MAYKAYRKYIPRADGAAAMWASAFAATPSAGPDAFGVSVEMAASIAEAVAAFVTAHQTALAPETRTATAVLEKNLARAAMENLIRPVVRGIQARPSLPDGRGALVVTDPQRESLGLPIHAKAATRAPTPPETAPALHIAAIHPGAHTLRLADAATPTRNARPAGTAGAQIFYRLTPLNIAGVPAADTGDAESNWRLAGLATRSTYRLEYPTSAPGTRVAIAARWYTRRGTYGPRGNPITTTVAA